MPKVIDENVLVVANDLTRVSLGQAPLCPEANDLCRIACAEQLRALTQQGGVILDSGTEYFDKYRAHAHLSGQPGVADAFIKTLYERGYSSWAVRVNIADDTGYRLPQEIIDSAFDRDDLLWLSGSYNATGVAEIVNAVDSDYRDFVDLLERYSIPVEELCHC